MHALCALMWAAAGNSTACMHILPMLWACTGGLRWPCNLQAPPDFMRANGGLFPRVWQPTYAGEPRYNLIDISIYTYILHMHVWTRPIPLAPVLMVKHLSSPVSIEDLKTYPQLCSDSSQLRPLPGNWRDPLHRTQSDVKECLLRSDPADLPGPRKHVRLKGGPHCGHRPASGGRCRIQSPEQM